MDKNRGMLKERVVFFALGILVMLCLFILTGASSGSVNNGRYQISAWAGRFNESSGGCGAFIMDTATGTTKPAYTIIYGNPGTATIFKNNLRKNFFKIK